jgi:hypothetical protein
MLPNNRGLHESVKRAHRAKPAATQSLECRGLAPCGCFGAGLTHAPDDAAGQYAHQVRAISDQLDILGAEPIAVRGLVQQRKPNCGVHASLPRSRRGSAMTSSAASPEASGRTARPTDAAFPVL